jgi:DNA polymerase-3 subunit delta
VITLLTGENSFEVNSALQQIVAEFDGAAEKFDGSELEARQLPDLLMGATLFANKRLVIIKNLSENKPVWEALTDWLKRLSDDIHLVLVEAKPDKRTRTFKDLKAIATVREFAAWTERDSFSAEAWVINEAKKQGWELDKKSAQTLIGRVGMDQWLLASALEKLAVLDNVTPQTIAEHIDANPKENVFNLFEAALNGDGPRVSDMIRTLELTEDPYMVFGLLSGQAFQLAALAVSDKPSSEVAKDIGAHPFAVSKLSSHAKRLSKTNVREIIAAFADADDAMKSSGGEPWLLIERTLIKVSTI